MQTPVQGDFHLFGHLWLKRGEKNFIGPGRIELLEQIMLHGSITKAAKAMKMSYKAAWDSVDAMNTLAPKPLVERITGGKGGGGTVITAYAKELIAVYRDVTALQQKHLSVLESSFSDVLIDRQAQPFGFSRLSGTVTQITGHDDNAGVSIDVCGHTLTAHTPRTFLALHEVKEGDSINLLIESDNIVLSAANSAKSSTRNVLSGNVINIERSGNDVTVSIGLCDDTPLLARITESSLMRLGIELDDTVYASFKAYNITLLPPKGSKR
jgi:molybdate transport system regulatory protein